MSFSKVNITRLKPSDLYILQIQTANNALISDVIKCLQSNFASNLNTSCPTCSATGFLKPGNINLPCYTCNGYLIYNTSGGGLTPPSNPYSTIVGNRILPADLYEALIGFPSSTTLDVMITSIQGNFENPPTSNCPQCTHTGIVTIGNNSKVCCPLCNGMQKTIRPYSFANGKASLVIPTIALPDPLPSPPNTNNG